MRSILFGLLLACSATLLATPAVAWPTIDVTASEVLSVDPPRVRTTFVVGSEGYNPGCNRQYFEVGPIDTAALHVFECGAPAGWNCGEALPAGSGRIYFANPNHAPGMTFTIVTESAEPCVRFYFVDVVLLGTASAAGVIHPCNGDACLQLDAPVPTQSTTWGSLKVQYR